MYVVLKDIEDFEIIEICSCLNKESTIEAKFALIDFMYKFKDKKYLYTAY